MQFYVKDKEEQVLGPVDQETLMKWVETDKVFPATPVRNSMLPAWKKAEDFAFLNELLAEQEKRLGEDHPDVHPELEEQNRFGNRLKSVFSREKKKENAPVRTSFQNAYVPDPPGLGLRMRAALYDWIVLLAAALVIGGVGTGAAFLKAASQTDSSSPFVTEELRLREKLRSEAEKLAEAEKKAEKASEEAGDQQHKDSSSSSSAGNNNRKGLLAVAQERAEFHAEEIASSENGTANHEVSENRENTPEKGKEDASATAVSSAIGKLNRAIGSLGAGRAAAEDGAAGMGEGTQAVMETAAPRAPAKTDDVLKGFRSGSKWTDTESGKVYNCLSASESSAFWCGTEELKGIYLFCAPLWLLFVLLYYGLSLALRGQTFGMWFWGIFITRGYDCMVEVLPLRAYLFAVLGLILGITMPFTTLCGRKPAVYEILTDVRVIRIAAKSK